MGCKGVDVRSFYLILPIAAEVSVTQVVEQQEYHVGLLWKLICSGASASSRGRSSKYQPFGFHMYNISYYLTILQILAIFARLN